MAGAVTFLQFAESASDLTVYTFAAQSLGTAVGDRCIIVGVGARDTGVTPQSIVSVTVGGVSATSVRQAISGATNSTLVGLFIAEVPSGATGDVVVTFSEGVLRCEIAMFRAVGINPVASDSDSSIVADPTVNLDIPAEGIAVTFAATSSTTTAVWNDITERHDDVCDGTTMSSGCDDFSTIQSGLTISCNFSAPGDSAGVFASWGPTAAGGTLKRNPGMAGGIRELTGGMV